MTIVDILTVTLTVINMLLVFFIGAYNIMRDKKVKRSSKNKLWLQASVLSDEKNEQHFAALADALNSQDSLPDKCKAVNNAMLDYFYTSINYVVFFDAKDCDTLKHEIMKAIDEILYALISSDNKLTSREVDKLLKIYRIKIVYLLYKFDMSNDESI